MKTIPRFALLSLSLLVASAHAATLFPTDDTYSTITPAKPPKVTKTSLASVTGALGTMAVSQTHTAFIRFNAANELAGTSISKATLTLYFPSVTKAGELGLHVVTSNWHEKFTGADVSQPTAAPSFGTIPVGNVIAKQFVIVDVTKEVQDWASGAVTDYGFAVDSPDGVANVLLGAKEGSGTGYPATIEIDTVPPIAAGTITAADIAAGAVGSAQIANGAITSANIAANAVGNAQIASGAIMAANIATGAVGSAQIASGAITGTNIAANAAIPGTSLAAGSVSSTQLASSLTLSGSVTASTFVATNAAIPTNVTPVLGMAWVSPGTFIMGSPTTDPDSNSNEQPQTVVTITHGFWIGVHPVTQAEYQAVIGPNPSTFSGNPNNPVETVTWPQATNYCATLTTNEQTAGRIPAGWVYRLPTEAEWEYCCRAGARTTRYSYGDDLGADTTGGALGNYAWYAANQTGTTHPVEQKLANPWGLMDMHGHVRQWCQDLFGPYPGGSLNDPQGATTGTNRVFRGAGWGYAASFCRSAQRSSGPPTYAADDLGLRVLLAPVQP